MFHVAASVDHAPSTIFWRPAKVTQQQPSEVISFSYWSIKLWFHTKGKLAAMIIIPSSWGFPTGPVKHLWL
jgi:hypothetical protein